MDLKTKEISDLVGLLELFDYLVIDSKTVKKLCIKLGKKLEKDINYEIPEKILIMIITHYPSLFYDERYNNGNLDLYFPNLKDRDLENISFTLFKIKYPNYSEIFPNISKMISKNFFLIKELHKECINIPNISDNALLFGSVKVVKFLISEHYYKSRITEKFCDKYRNIEDYDYSVLKYLLKEQNNIDIWWHSIIRCKNYKIFKLLLKYREDDFVMFVNPAEPKQFIYFGCLETTIMYEKFVEFKKAVLNSDFFSFKSFENSVLFSKMMYCKIEDLPFYIKSINNDIILYIILHLADFGEAKIEFFIKKGVFVERKLFEILAISLELGYFKVAKIIFNYNIDTSKLLDAINIDMKILHFLHENKIKLNVKNTIDKCLYHEIQYVNELEILIFLIQKEYTKDLDLIFLKLNNTHKHGCIETLLRLGIYPLRKIKYYFDFSNFESFHIYESIIKMLKEKDLYEYPSKIADIYGYTVCKKVCNIDVFKNIFKFYRGVMENMQEFIKILELAIVYNKEPIKIIEIFEYLNDMDFDTKYIFDIEHKSTALVLSLIIDTGTFNEIFPKYCKPTHNLFSLLLNVEKNIDKILLFPIEAGEYFRNTQSNIIYQRNSIFLKINSVIYKLDNYRNDSIIFETLIEMEIPILINKLQLNFLIQEGIYSSQVLRMVRDKILIK